MGVYRSVTLAAWGLLLLATGAVAQETKKPATAEPTPSTEQWWLDRHASFNARVQQGDAELLFIGDSITHVWEKEGHAVWDRYYGSRHAVNLGIGGDPIQSVLWRMQNGNLDGSHPKLAVLMIGTNNSGDTSSEAMAEGIQAIVEKLRAKQPQMKVLVLAIFPRGPNPEDRRRQVNIKTNERIAKLADDKNVFFLDIGPKFLEADGTISKEVMPDLLHLSPKGYAIWAEAIEPMVAKLMQ